MLSVIMLTYNRKKMVRQMIEDVQNQSYKDFEYVIVNNGSTDGTDRELVKYAKLDARIKIITLPQSCSIGKARNVGVQSAQGELLTFVDDDDRVQPDFLEFLYALLDENDADISMCGTTEGDGKTRTPQCLFDEKMVLSGEEAVRLLLGRKYIRAGMPTKLYKREILEKYPFEENYKNEDIHTQYKYLLEAKKVAIHGLDKYYITRHEHNVSGFTSDAGSWDLQTIQDYLTAFRNRTEFIKENAPNTYELSMYTEWSFMISMIEKIDRFQLRDCEALKEELIEYLRRHKEQFVRMPEIKDFELEWIGRYID